MSGKVVQCAATAPQGGIKQPGEAGKTLQGAGITAKSGPQEKGHGGLCSLVTEQSFPFSSEQRIREEQ